MQTLQDNYKAYKKGEKIEALFLFQAGTVWASMESVYESCKQDGRFDVKLVWVEDTTVETSHMVTAKEFLNEKRLPYVRYEEVKWEEYCPHIVFIQFPYDVACHTPETLSIQFRARGCRVIYIPYGIEISDTQIARKDHFHNFVVENSWRVYTCCDGMKEEYNMYCRNRKAVRVTGSPKFDAITYKEKLPLKDEIVKGADGKKVVVWKMHFPKKIVENGVIKQITPFMSEYIEFAQKMNQYKDLFFIVLAHPKMLKGIVASDCQGDETMMQQVKQLMKILSTKDNVYIDTDDDYRNSFYHADVIVMDRSAVMIEAAMLDVPILLMKNTDYSESMTKPVQYIVDSFEQGTCCKDIQNFILKICSGIDDKAEIRRQRIKETFPFNDGLCGERIKEDIVDGLMKEEKKASQVILYGTGEVCRYYLERQKWNNNIEFEVVAIVDSNSAKWGESFYGRTIISPYSIKELDFDAIVIMTEVHYFEIKKALVYDLYLDERKIWRLDEFVLQLGEIEAWQKNI